MRGKKTGGGSRKGRPNRVTAEVHAVIKAALDRQASKVDGWFDSVGETDPARALDLYARLAEFAAPKLARQEVTGDVKSSVTVRFIGLPERCQTPSQSK